MAITSTVGTCDRCGQIREVDEYEHGVRICFFCCPTADPQSAAEYEAWLNSLPAPIEDFTAVEDLKERLISAVHDCIKPDCVSFDALIERVHNEYRYYEKETKNG